MSDCLSPAPRRTHPLLPACLALWASAAWPLDASGVGSGLRFRVAGPCIEAEAIGVPLGLIAQVLQAETPIRLSFNDPKTASYPIYGRIDGCLADQVIRQLLNGRSYIVSALPQGWRVVVLAAPDVDGADAIGFFPRTLDEFRRIEVPEASDDPETASADQATLREAMFRRALEVLQSAHAHLYQDAIDQLELLEDHRATEALVRLAHQGPARRLATEALSRMVVQARDEDLAVIGALKQLAVDSDPSVRVSASGALEQIRLARIVARDP